MQTHREGCPLKEVLLSSSLACFCCTAERREKDDLLDSISTHDHHYYYSAKDLHPLLRSTPPLNSLQGFDFKSILGQAFRLIFVIAGQKQPKYRPKTDLKLGQSPGSRQGEVLRLKMYMSRLAIRFDFLMLGQEKGVGV